MDEKNIGVGDFNGTRVNSLFYNCSGDFSKSASNIEESQAIEREHPISYYNSN